MTLNATVIKGGLAALMIMIMTAGAYAWSATATGSVNLRQGPGTQFRVLDVLHRGQIVEVDYCRSNWCFVEQGRHRPSGWVSASYLRPVHAQPRPPVYQPPVYQPPAYKPPYYQPRPPYYRPPSYRPPVYQPPSHRPPSGSNPGSQVCFNGPNGYFCFGN